MNKKRSNRETEEKGKGNDEKRIRKFSSSKNPNAKKEKRYRFKSFNDRIEDIDINSIQRIGGYRGTGPTGTDSTWFELSLNEWKELNCSAAFAKFCYAVTPLTGTLAKLLFNREKIINEIFEVLRNSNNKGLNNSNQLALIPVLSLTAMLAKDLGSEFHRHFADFFQLLLPILSNTTDPDIIEAAFASLLYVFKCILTDLLNDLPRTFDAVFQPLVSLSGKNHLRRFGAQCFGYLLRKSLNIGESGFFEAIEPFNNNSEIKKFLAESFVAAILDEKTGRFRICLKGLLLEITGYLKISESQSAWNDILRFLTIKLLDASDSSHNLPLWNIYVELLDDPESHFISNTLIDTFAFRRGTLVRLHSLILPGLVKFKSIELCVHFLRSMDLETTLLNRHLTVTLIESVLDNNFRNLLGLCKGLIAVGWLHYDLILSDLVCTYIRGCDEPDLVIELLEILLPKYTNSSASLSHVSTKLLCSLASDDAQLCLRALKILIDHYPCFQFPEDLLSLATKKFEEMIKYNSIRNRDEMNLWTEIILNKNLKVSLSFDEISKFIIENPLLYPEQLKIVQVALHSSGISTENFEVIDDISLLCLRSHSSEWRKLSLNLIGFVYKHDPILSESVQLLSEIECIPSDLENYRDKLLHLRKLEHLRFLLSEDNKRSISFSNALIINYLVGFIQIKLSLLWPEGFRILSKLACENTEIFSFLMSEAFNNIENHEENFENDIELEKNNASEVFYAYDFEIEDVGLNNLKKVRDAIYEGNFVQASSSDKVIAVRCVSTLISSILKLFASNPVACLSHGSFLESTFLPLFIRVFSTSDNKNKLIQSNLNLILQTLSSIKLEFTKSTNFEIEQIEELLLRFLSHGDLQVQNYALDALFNTKKFGGSLSNHWKNRLKSLLNDNLFREELTNLTAEAESISKLVHWHTLLAPLTIRILFGRFIARKGSTAGRHSLPLRRKMIMNCFGTWDEKSLDIIVDFLLQSSKDEPKRQIGLLNILEDVFGSLGRKLSVMSMNRLIENLLDIHSQSQNYCHEIDENDKDHEDICPEDDHRRTRQLIMKRLLQLFNLFEFTAMKKLSPFLQELFNSILNPRIDQLSSHFTNSTTSSALLEIIVCISSNCNATEINEILTILSPRLLDKVIEAFNNPSAKPLIISQLISFFENILVLVKKSDELKSLLIPEINPLLDAFDFRLKGCTDMHNTLRIVSLVQIISPYVSSSDQATRLCKTFEKLLKVKLANEHIRTHLISGLAELLTKSSNDAFSKSLFEVVSAQWNVIKGRPGREALCSLFECFSKLMPESFALAELATLLRDLNSWLPNRLNEPNFDLRLTAFAKLRRSIESGTLSCVGSFDVFVPICWSMIYFLQDVEELSIRNQSFGVLKTLIKTLADLNITDQNYPIYISSTEYENDEADISFEDSVTNPSEHTTSSLPHLVQHIILPSIKKGLKSKFEIIRIEFVSLLDLLISTFPSKHPFDSLYTLIRPVENQDNSFDLDEENIFRNIYHIQEPRRNRAIRQIGELASSGKLTGLSRTVIEDLLLPLVYSSALPDPRGELEFSVSEAMQKDSIITCGALIAQLPWRAFLKKLSRFVTEVSANSHTEQWNRAVLRLLPAMISQFKISEEFDEFTVKVDEDIVPFMFRLLHKSESTGGFSDNSTIKKIAKTSSTGPLPSVDKISVKNSLRVPIAISIGHLIKIVSRGSLDSPVILTHLPRLLMNLLNVLKQKDAETRDVARGALVKIMGTFGTPFLPFLLKEARTLLNRGYQRHVLTYTAHAVLVEFLRIHELDSMENVALCNLDTSADLLIDMALASSFGFQATERASIEWSGKQPEVRAFKGPEIIALTAQFTSQDVLEKSLIQKITKIALLDLDESVVGTLNTRGTGATDEKAEVIDRIDGESFDLLLKSLFLNGLYPLLLRDPERLPALLSILYTIVEYPCDSGSRSHLHRLQSRVFEFVSHIINNFKTNDSNFISHIIPYISLTKEYILERGKHVDALTSAINLFNQFVAYKYLHSSISDLQPLLHKLFTIILKGNSGNVGESAQLSAAYKLTSTLIREWPELQVNDTQIKALIEYTRLQLENTHQQSLTFSLIRSLISRQIVLLQLFELMDTVRVVMLTSHQSATRQQCRSAYVHFLTNYPMAAKKLEEQLDFLLANIRYEFASGRESCIEVMNDLIVKLPSEVIEGIAEAWFVGLAVQLSKENSSDGSTEVAEVILKTIAVLFNRLSPGKRRDNLELLLLRWILQSPKLSVQGAAWKIFIPILKEISAVSRDQLLEKAVELMAADCTPEDLLKIIIKSVEESINHDLISEELLNSIIKEASDKKFFTENYEISTRHSIALLWNSILQ